jgi:hypothetical protein
MIEIFVIRDAWLPSDELKGFRPEFHNSTRHNLPHKIHCANSLRTMHCAQFTAHNSPYTIHRGTIHSEKIKIPLDEFLILLDLC